MFALIHDVTVNNILVMSLRVFLGTSTKQGLMCPAQGHNIVPPVRLELSTPRSLVKLYTVQPQPLGHCAPLTTLYSKLSMS